LTDSLVDNSFLEMNGLSLLAVFGLDPASADEESASRFDQYLCNKVILVQVVLSKPQMFKFKQRIELRS